MKENCEVENKPKSFKDFLRSPDFWKPAIAVGVGAILGFLYYRFVGCEGGTCAITSNPYLSIIFGGLLGFLFVNRPCKTC